MQLIGMLDSPYVRRIAISLRMLGIPFDHQPLSVFSTFSQFQKINPVVKAPTLICDDGEVLMESSLILDYVEALASPEKTLMPSSLKERQHTLRTIGLALAACEKTVQIIYERNLRPLEKQHEPWLTRIRGQLIAAYTELELEIARRGKKFTNFPFIQSDITAAVAWKFTQMTVPEYVSVSDHPSLHSLSNHAEQLPEFLAAPPEYGRSVK